MKHKHYNCIVAWAGGAEIQVQVFSEGDWKDVDMNGEEQYEHYKYRIKPEPKPDWSKHIRISSRNNEIYDFDLCLPQFANLVLTFEGETGELKSAEVLK